MPVNNNNNNNKNSFQFTRSHDLRGHVMDGWISGRSGIKSNKDNQGSLGMDG